ncbi:MAG: hypothetical protein NT015_06000 [Alphaproteobacteria bacterium]|nr:hypothetical protein [Alphaproteobacteria bacterium]
MFADVIQHTKPRRKRAPAQSWTARHLVLLTVVIAAIIAAIWLAPEIAAPPVSIDTSPTAPTPQTLAPLNLPRSDIAADLARPTPVARRHEPARQTGIPLNAAVTPTDEYEILSAAELDGISQARN